MLVAMLVVMIVLGMMKRIVVVVGSIVFIIGSSVEIGVEIGKGGSIEVVKIGWIVLSVVVIASSSRHG